GGPFLAGRQVPELEVPVSVPRTQYLAVRSHGHRQDQVRVRLLHDEVEGGSFLGRGHVPELDRAFAGRDQRLAVRGEDHALDVVGMLQGGNLLAARYVPEPRRVVMTPRGQCLTIRCERNGVHGGRVSPQRGYLLAGSQIPEFDGRVVTSRCQRLAI